MPVIECAIIKIRPGYDYLDLYEQLMDCFDAEDDWTRRHMPHLLRERGQNNLSSLYMTRPADAGRDPTYLLITAPWDSPEAHGEWIRSDENKTTFPPFCERHLSTDDDSVSLCHVVPGANGPPPTFADRPGFVVSRVLVDGAQDEERIARQVEDHPGAWAGWAIEKPSAGEGRELVVFSPEEWEPNCGRKGPSFSFYHMAVPQPES